jgi:hypothetical protein
MATFLIMPAFFKALQSQILVKFEQSPLFLSIIYEILVHLVTAPFLHILSCLLILLN